MAEDKKLSLNKMLELAEHVDNWEYVPPSFWYNTWGHYMGKINEISIKIGSGRTFWPAPFRHIIVYHGNIELGEFPDSSRYENFYDRRLDALFYSIPGKIKQQGLDSIEKIIEKENGRN